MYCSNVNKKSFQPPLNVIVKGLGDGLPVHYSLKYYGTLPFLSFLASTKLQDMCISELPRQGFG
jgi:hypothetical protein